MYQIFKKYSKLHVINKKVKKLLKDINLLRYQLSKERYKINATNQSNCL